MFATIYETEGLEHHMAVERAHVSLTLEKKIRTFSPFQSIFGKLDVDHDGDITEEEFIQVFQTPLEKNKCHM